MNPHTELIDLNSHIFHLFWFSKKAGIDIQLSRKFYAPIIGSQQRSYSHTPICGIYLKHQIWTFAITVRGVLLLNRPVFQLHLFVMALYNIELYFSVLDTRACNESIGVLCPFYQACRTIIKAFENVSIYLQRTDREDGQCLYPEHFQQ